MSDIYKLKKLLKILIEKEREEKTKAFNNWTVSEYAFHNGLETAYNNILKEITPKVIC